MQHLSKTALLGLFLMATFLAHSQTFIKAYDVNAPLTWDDFMGKAPQTNTASHAEFYFGYRPLKEKTNDSVIYRLKAVGYFDKGLSYVAETKKNDERLRFHQVQFKLLEIHRRQLQQDLDQAKRKTDFDALFRNINATFVSLKTSFEREYSNTGSTTVLEKWEFKTDSLLASQGAWPKPAATYSPWSLGVSYSLDLGLFGRPASSVVDYAQSFTIGLYGAYKNINVGVNGYAKLYEFGGAPSNLGTTLNPAESNSEAYAALCYDFWAGYRFFNGKKLEVMPQIGISTTPFQNQAELLESNRNKLFAGVTLNYVIRRNLYLSSSPVKEQNTYGITGVYFSGYVSQYQFRNGDNSLYYMLSLGINFRGGNTR